MNDEELYYEISGLQAVAEFKKIDTSNISILDKNGIWSHPCFDEYKKKEIKNIENTKMDNKLKSIGRCSYCNSTKTTLQVVQDRSGDEGASHYRFCLTCAKKSRI